MTRRYLAATLLLSGCMMAPSVTRNGCLVVRPFLQSGSFAAQTTISPYTQTSIQHLDLKLFTYDDTEHDQNIQRTLLNAQLDNPIVFANLKANTTYRIKAYAYASADNSLLISSNDEDSYTDVVLTNDDRPTLVTLKVKLIDRTFNGQATSSLTITSGGYSAVGSESLQIPFLGMVTTYAGNGAATWADGISYGASFRSPRGLAVDASGNLYVGDDGNRRVRKISQSGTVTTIAGNGVSGADDGNGTSATFTRPVGLAVDTSGNVYVADVSNNRIRKISPAGVVSTFAGSSASFADGTGTAGLFNSPYGLAADAAGNIYVADEANNRIRKITPAGVVSTVAGNGSAGCIDGTGSAASFSNPSGVALDDLGNIYVADFANNRIRKINAAGYVSTLAGNDATTSIDGLGTAASFYHPVNLAIDAQRNIWVTDYHTQRIRKVAPNGLVTTVAGNGSATFVNGTGIAASFYGPEGIAIDTFGNIFIGDCNNNRIRRIQ